VRIGPQPGWRVEVGAGRLRASADGQQPDRPDEQQPGGQQLDRQQPNGGKEGLLRALCAAWWPTGGGRVDVEAGDDVTSVALTALGLAE
jgi:hypothetical protein